MRTFFCSAVLIMFFLIPAQGLQAQALDEPAGEMFGAKVPRKNYDFVKDVLKVFGNRWGKQPTTHEELKQAIWEQLALSYVAFSQNIFVTQDEFEREVSRVLKESKAGFDWKADKPAYEKWVKQKMKEPTDLFENQLRHLLQLQKLRDMVLDSIKPQVFDKQELQKFLDETSTLRLELIQFPKQGEAESFYKKASGRTDFWQRQKKRRPTDFKELGEKDLRSLMEEWGIPAEALTKMMQRPAGDIYPPRPIRQGFAVFKILGKRLADESAYPLAKDPYYADLIKKKKQEGMDEWLRQLKQQANIKVYNKEDTPRL